MELNQRPFLRLSGAAMAVASIGSCGLRVPGEVLPASVRPFKLVHITENTQQEEHLSPARLVATALQVWFTERDIGTVGLLPTAMLREVAPIRRVIDQLADFR